MEYYATRPSHLLTDLEEAPWSLLNSCEDVNEMWECWKQLFFHVLDSHAPKKSVRVREHNLPWISAEIRVLLRTRTYFLTKAHRTNDPDDWRKYRKLRNKVTTTLRKAEKEYFQEVARNQGNPRAVWKDLNKVIGRGRKDRIGTIQVNGRDIVRSLDKAEEFNRYYVSCIPSPPSIDPGSIGFQALEDSFSFQRVDAEDVEKILRCIKVNKATGPDGLSPRLLRLTAPAIAKSLATVFNASLERGEIPNDWKVANVSPVFKAGDKGSMSNYRPISVLPEIAKLFEKLVHQQLYAYLQEHNILHPAQSGFRPGHCTQDVVVASVDDWRRGLDNNHVVGAVLVDLSRAFDSISHDLLLCKMDLYGIRGKAKQWFHSYLSDRKQRVVVDGEVSPWSTIRMGVPQGSILGPLLFTLFINDLPSVLQSTKTMLYADDTTIYHSCPDPQQLQEALADDLLRMTSWLKTNHLHINVRKTKLLLLARRGRAHELDRVRLSVNDVEIERQNNVKFLGVIIDSELNWEKHVAAVRRKCIGGLATVRRLRHTLPASLKARLYSALIQPHLDYCAVAWQECSKLQQRRIEQIQNYGMRQILTMPPRTSSELLRGVLSWDQLTKRRSILRLQLMHRCMHGLAPEYLCSRFQTNSTLPNYAKTRGWNNVHLRRPNTDWYKRSFEYQGAKDWNSLPNELKSITSKHVFTTCLRCYL